jgi:DNA-binding transcriptional MerR regulator
MGARKTVIPKKLYYSISEVCTLTSLEPHVLRYWETEFPQLRPKKNSAGYRAYRDKDIDVINYIKKLLYEEKFTIPGAKKKLGETKVTSEPEALAQTTPTVEGEKISFGSIADIRNELKEILDLLKDSAVS